MGNAGAVGGGIGAVALGVVILMYQIGRWRGGDPTPIGHFVMGAGIAALLLLGGGILGAMGGAAATLGDGIGTYALEKGADVAVSGASRPPVTGGEKAAVGGVIVGLGALALYLGLIKSGRYDLKAPLWRGALCGVCLGAAGGLLGMAVGLLKTSGNTVGYVLLNVI
jgi:hypothetical protein